MASRRRLPVRERVHLLIEDVYVLVCMIYVRLGRTPPPLD